MTSKMKKMQHFENGIVNLTHLLPLFVATLILFSFGSVAGSVLRLPEFAEPIKNVTLPIGSDVELSCDVRHLGTYRVTWSWKREDEQKFLAIGIVKITHNPRVQISRIQKSDDVTQFNLYLYNVRKEDEGVYFCSVNSNPMIEQHGTLDVNGEDSTQDPASHYSSKNGKIFSGQSTLPLLKQDSSTSTYSNDASVSNGEAWENARKRLSEFLSTMMKFSYSYWFS